MNEFDGIPNHMQSNCQGKNRTQVKNLHPKVSPAYMHFDGPLNILKGAAVLFFIQTPGSLNVFNYVWE